MFLGLTAPLATLRDLPAIRIFQLDSSYGGSAGRRCEVQESPVQKGKTRPILHLRWLHLVFPVAGRDPPSGGRKVRPVPSLPLVPSLFWDNKWEREPDGLSFLGLRPAPNAESFRGHEGPSRLQTVESQ